jgi:hypothetical protein
MVTTTVVPTVTGAGAWFCGAGLEPTAVDGAGAPGGVEDGAGAAADETARGDAEVAASDDVAPEGDVGDAGPGLFPVAIVS